MITSASFIAAVNLVATGADDVIFHPSLLQRMTTVVTRQIRPTATVKLVCVAIVPDRSCERFVTSIRCGF
jgi:hypothetical protein